MFHDRRAGVPGHPRAARENVVAVTRHDRDALDVMDAKLRGDRSILRRDSVEAIVVESRQVHFVDREHDVLNAQQLETM